MNDNYWNRTFLGYALGAGLALVLSGCGGQSSNNPDSGTDSGTDTDTDSDTDIDTDTDTDVDTDSDTDSDTDTDTDTDLPSIVEDSFTVMSGVVGEELLELEVENGTPDSVYVDTDPTDGASDDDDITMTLSGSKYVGVFSTPGFYKTLTANLELDTDIADDDEIDFPDDNHPLKIFAADYIDRMGRNEGDALEDEVKVDQYTPDYTEWLTIKANLSSYGVSAGAIALMDQYEAGIGASQTIENVLVTKFDSGGGSIIYLTGVSDDSYFGLDTIGDDAGKVYEGIDLIAADIDAAITCIEDM